MDRYRIEQNIISAISEAEESIVILKLFIDRKKEIIENNDNLPVETIEEYLSDIVYYNTKILKIRKYLGSIFSSGDIAT